MAVYTTEVRTICEQFAGLDSRVDADNIEVAIEGSWEKIFGTHWNTYDPAYKEVLCGKILRHYWMREIGGESVGLWLHWLRTRMGEIMPYYNDLYKSVTLEFNPLHDYELTHTSKKTTDGSSTNESVSEGTSQRTVQDEGSSEDTTENTTVSEDSSEINRTGETTNNNSQNTQKTNQNINKFNDTPQGSLQNVLDGTYLTNATIDDGTSHSEVNTEGKQNSTSSDKSIGNSDVQESGKVNSSHSNTVQSNGASTGRTEGTATAKSTEDYTLTVMGKTGGQSYSKLLTEFRATLLNIDMMIINDLSDLFMGLWA